MPKKRQPRTPERFRAEYLKRYNSAQGFAYRAVRMAIFHRMLPLPSSLPCEGLHDPSLPIPLGAVYHHVSYEPDNWLDVFPLCRACHELLHDPALEDDTEPETTASE